ncbi:MAG: hypothetical protein M3N19_08965 [Candidatus Eremiobacteraeota bacterium]|nr:hypothetical protein [Candidatus Eremiobacteraeota bacterium]
MNERPAPDLKDVPNFGWLASWLGRGAHPNPAGFKWLCETGEIKTIVNLRAEDNTEALLAPLGFRPLQIPVLDNKAPTQEQAMQWLALCADSSNHPIFVHCQSGHGRTSTFCILVRLAQGWKLEDAIDEETRNYKFEPDRDIEQVQFLKGIKDLAKSGALKLPDLPS